MPDSLPNLAGVVTKDLVDTIGSGNFKASYVNWSRTINLLREHAPGWLPEIIPADDGGLIHRDPVGGHLMIRFRHLDGTVTPEIPQAIMDHRNASIPFDKITSRDVSDTHRRGACLAAAMTFGLAYELWAKMPLESGYSQAVLSETAPVATQETAPSSVARQVTKEAFLEAAISKGLSTYSAEALLKIINGNYENGIKTLGMKDSAWVEEQNKKNAPAQEEPAKPAAAARAKKTAAKPDASEY
jgi:hypothetical protein